MLGEASIAISSVVFLLLFSCDSLVDAQNTVYSRRNGLQIRNEQDPSVSLSSINQKLTELMAREQVTQDKLIAIEQW